MLRVLVATEDGAERAVVREALERRGDVERIVLVEDGVQAYVALRREPLDLAIVSAALARIDGLVLVRTVRRSPLLPARPRTLLVLSPSAAHRVREALEALPAGLLVRPFDARTLLERVDRILRAPLPPALPASDPERAASPFLPEGLPEGLDAAGTTAGSGEAAERGGAAWAGAWVRLRARLRSGPPSPGWPERLRVPQVADRPSRR